MGLELPSKMTAQLVVGESVRHRTRSVVERALDCAPILRATVSVTSFAFALGGTLGATGFASAAECDFEPGMLQMILEPGGSIGEIQAAFEVDPLDSLPPLYLIELPEGCSETEYRALMASHPLVRSVELAYRNETPEGTYEMMVAAVGGKLSEYEDQEVVTRLRLREGQAHGTGEGTIVAIVDTGVRGTHPVLIGRIAQGGYDFVDNDDDADDPANGTDDDLDGYVDDAAGHGTMIAGIVHLVAPGALLLPVRVLDDEGRGLTFDVAKGIRRSVTAGADIINLSLGLTCHSEILDYEVSRAESAGVCMVAAAGNAGTEEPPYYPASDSRVLSVAAVDSNDVKPDFSNYHETVDLSAPGVGILAPYTDGAFALGDGTSFASPFVAGQLALIRGFHPGLTKTEIEDVARLGSVNIDHLPGNEPYAGKLGRGRIDALLTWMHTPTSASDEDDPRVQTIGATFPNPARGLQTIYLSTSLPDATLRILDAQGRLLRILNRGASDASWSWDGRDANDRIVGRGVYFLEYAGRIHGRVVRLD